MGQVTTAFRAFFKTLFNAQMASEVAQVLDGKPAVAAPPAIAAPEPVKPSVPVAPPPPMQNPAVTLLAALQREARLIDFLQEDIQPYTDEQIGAAVREIHRDAGKVLKRMFGLQALVAAEEGATVDVPAGFDAGQYRLTGKVASSAPQQGTLRHHGWTASHCDLPTYTGSAAAALTVAPAEVEL
ncbi:DUF2760 domain-containing protein [bacterium]|nr:DUF2760 domain-containing protein [bacterium]